MSVDIQDPMPLRPGCQCRSQLPRSVRLFGAEFHRNAATLGTCDAEIDVREAPVLAVAFVIDAERLPTLSPISVRSRPSKPPASDSLSKQAAQQNPECW